MASRILFRFCSEQGAKKNIKFDYVYGINPVVAAIHAGKRQLEELYICQTQENKPINPRISNIIDHANKIKLPIKLIMKKQIEKLAGQGQPHQNIVLKCSPKKFYRVENLDEIEQKFIVFFDQITDPQNFGSIIRTAFFMGIQGYIAEENNRCPLTPTISKVSSGAVEMIDMHCAPEAWKLVKNDKYIVIGTGKAEGKKNYTTSDDLSSVIGDKIPVVVFGSEADGISKSLLKQCDIMCSIPQGPNYVFPQTLVDSLNVGVSAGIILHHILKGYNKL